MRFVVDAQLPPVLADWLNANDVEAVHVAADPGASASDKQIAQFAHQRGAVIVTKDADFAELAEHDPEAPQVLWVRVGNTTKAALLERFEAAFEVVTAELKIGKRVVTLK